MKNLDKMNWKFGQNEWETWKNELEIWKNEWETWKNEWETWKNEKFSITYKGSEYCSVINTYCLFNKKAFYRS
jgi:hypothetical protein